MKLAEVASQQVLDLWRLIWVTDVLAERAGPP
jgi:hypothetical protein